MNDRTRDRYECRPAGVAMERAILGDEDNALERATTRRDVLERARRRVEDAMPDGRGRRPWSDTDDERSQDAAPDSSLGER